MANQSDTVEINELRQAATQSIVNDVAVTEVDSATRNLMDDWREEAKENGFTDADVVRAILRPIFSKTKGCDCYSCKARRGEWGEDEEPA